MEYERAAFGKQRFAIEKKFSQKRFIFDKCDAAVQARDDIVKIFSEKTCHIER